MPRGDDPYGLYSPYDPMGGSPFAGAGLQQLLQQILSGAGNFGTGAMMGMNLSTPSLMQWGQGQPQSAQYGALLGRGLLGNPSLAVGDTYGLTGMLHALGLFNPDPSMRQSVTMPYSQDPGGA